MWRSSFGSAAATCFLWLLNGYSLHAQTLTGTIKNQKNGQAIPFANVGIVGTASGTVADEQGRYQLSVAGTHPTDTIRIASLGLRSRRLTVQELTACPNLLLEESAVELAAVQVQANGIYRRTHVLGNTGTSENSVATQTPTGLGSQVGTVIQLKRWPTHVLNVNFNIARTSSGVVTCRINLYRLDAQGRPTEERLLPHDLLVTTPVVKGTVTVDLRADHVVLAEDFFMAVEVVKWVGAIDNTQEMTFSCALGYTHNGVYLRSASFAPWKKASLGALLAGMQPKLSFFATVQD